MWSESRICNKGAVSTALRQTRKEEQPTLCSPNSSSRVSCSRANSLPWCINRCCSLLGFESSTSRIFCLSWPIVVDGGRPGKSRGALTLREGDTMEMWTARSSVEGAADDGTAFSAMTSKNVCWGFVLGGFRRHPSILKQARAIEGAQVL